MHLALRSAISVPEASIQSIFSKLAMRVFDVYANILKCDAGGRDPTFFNIVVGKE
jgi:hypothetical protein